MRQGTASRSPEVELVIFLGDKETALSNVSKRQLHVATGVADFGPLAAS